MTEHPIIQVISSLGGQINSQKYLLAPTFVPDLIIYDYNLQKHI